MVTHQIKRSDPITVILCSSLDYDGAFLVYKQHSQARRYEVCIHVHVEGYLFIIQPLLG